MIRNVIEDVELDDKDSLALYRDQILEGCWFTPKKQNQGGFDLVQIVPDTANQDVLVKLGEIFYQVTGATTHGLNLKAFADFAHNLVNAFHCEIIGIQVYMVTPSNVEYRQSVVKYPGQLSQHNVGNAPGKKWSMGQEDSYVQTLQFRQTVP